MGTKILGVLVIVLAGLLTAVFYISIHHVKSSPDQLFLSDAIEPKVVELEENNLDKLKEQIGGIKTIVVITKDKNKTYDATYYVRNAKNYLIPPHSSMGEFFLQFASGSGEAFANNCQDMSHWKHGNCTGPVYDSNGNIVTPRVCECIPKI